VYYRRKYWLILGIFGLRLGLGGGSGLVSSYYYPVIVIGSLHSMYMRNSKVLPTIIMLIKELLNPHLV